MKFAGFNLKQKHSVLQSMGYKGKANNKEMDNFIKSTPGNSNAYDMAVQVATDAVGGTIKKMAKGGVVGYAHGGLHETTGEEAVDGLSSDPPEDDVQREETVYAAMEAKRQIANNAAIGGLSLLIIGVLGGGMYLISLGIS